MGLLEEALRDSFAVCVAEQPAVDDPAGRAIRRARRIRRRRGAATAVWVVLSVALIGAGIGAATSGERRGGNYAVPGDLEIPAAVPLPVDVLTANRVVGARLTILFADLPTARAAWRVSDGWLVRTAGTDTLHNALWWVGQTGERGKLAEDVQVAVGRGPSGPRVAWGGNGRVTIATVRAGKLVDPVATTGTGQLGPVEIVGGGVLLSGPPTGAAVGAYDMWFPDQGGFVPGPAFTDRIIAGSGDGANLFGLRGQYSSCLALITPVGFVTTRSRCDLGLRLGDVVSSSPDGRWLATLSSTGVDLYSFDRVWSAAAPAVNWPIQATDLAWLDDGTFVVVDNSRVVRLWADDPERTESSEVTTTDGQPLRIITDLE